MVRSAVKFLAIVALTASTVGLMATDADTLSLAPVSSSKPGNAVPQSGTAAAVDPNSASAQAGTATKPKITCAVHQDESPAASETLGSTVKFLGIDVKQTKAGLRVLVKASGPISGLATKLSSPDRILVKLSGVGAVAGGLSKVQPLHKGVLERVRFAVKNSNEIWVVLDLSAKAAFKSSRPDSNTFELMVGHGGGTPNLSEGATPSPADAVPAAAAYPLTVTATLPDHAAANVAALPRINLMLFDLDVIYQGKQYKRFPCANFIYNVGDHFPLKRDFVSTLVFSHGFGAFVGNARMLDPQGHMLAQTETPFAFNLFNTLTEFMVELPWNVEFNEKGFYTLWVDLNGSDVLKQTFYVGQTTDAPPAQ